MSPLHRYGIATLYSCFNAVGALLLYLVHYRYLALARELGIAQTQQIELTVMKTIYLGGPYAILVFGSVFAVVATSEYLELSKQPPPDILFPALMFSLVFAEEMVGCYRILALNWVSVIISFLLSGIAAISYSCRIYFRRIRNRFDSLKGRISCYEFFAERLKLEHRNLQEIFNYLIWSVLVFVTGGVITVSTRPLEPIPSELVLLIVQNSVILGVWGFLGIWFGIASPILGNMLHLRLLLEELSQTVQLPTSAPSQRIMVRCHNCKTLNNEDATFCSNCGDKLK